MEYMNRKFHIVATTFSLVLSAGAQAFTPAEVLPTVDRFLSETSQRNIVAPKGLEARSAKTSFDGQLGKQTFLWAKAGAAAVSVGPLVTEQDILATSARKVLADEAVNLGLTQKMIDEAEVQFASYNGQGGAVVRFRQRVNGHQVFHRYLNVMLDREARPVAVSGYFAPDSGSAPTTFGLNAP
ncbi:MAG: hypothetical protein NTX56_05355, partial [Proteobacteria bacterium]|nr:hypothetical protein [Pseudomonadota bacterium]